MPAPDKPALALEIRTHDLWRAGRAIQAALEYRGKKIAGGGKEWFRTDRNEIVQIFNSIVIAS
jgi:hypothetical protein